MFKLFARHKKIIEYSESEDSIVDDYIAKSFGEAENVFHELVTIPGDIHIDILCIEPDANHDYYTLVTMNAGAYKMKVPSSAQTGNQTPYMELVIRLPKDWDMRHWENNDTDDETYYWPIRMLKTLARYPLYCKTYLGDGHTVDFGEPIFESLPYRNVLIKETSTLNGEQASVEIGKNKKVVFYEVIPIFNEELDYKLQNGSKALLKLMEDKGFPFPAIINPARVNYCE